MNTELHYKEKKLINIRETSIYLHVSESTARKLIRGRNGFGVQIGNRWYADKKKLDKWIESRTS